MPEKQTQSSNRIRETLGRLYEHQPPHFREYIRRYQEDPTSRVFAPLAEAYRRLGRLDEAIDICIEGVKHHPDFPGGRVALARCYLDKRKYTRAREELETVVGIAPDNLLAQRLLGDCFYNLKEMEKALHCYKIAAVLSPDDVGLQDKIHRMELQFNRGDFDRVSGAESLIGEIQHLESPVVSQAISRSQELSPKISAEALISEFGETDLDSEPVISQEPHHLASATEPNATELLLNEEAIENALEPVPGSEFEEDNSEDELRTSKIDTILGLEEEEGDSFKTEDVSKIFAEEAQPSTEITTQTLGDLYFAQGQFEKSLKIFEKLLKHRPSPEIAQKIQKCRAHLGVDPASLRRQQKIDVLNAILNKNRKNR